VQLRCLLFVDQPLRRRHDETEQRLTSKFSSFAGNDEPAISVVTKQPNSSARDRGQDELQGFIRRAERDHSSIRKISSASPGNEARSRCDGRQIVLPALVSPRRVDYGRSRLGRRWKHLRGTQSAPPSSQNGMMPEGPFPAARGNESQTIAVAPQADLRLSLLRDRERCFHSRKCADLTAIAQCQNAPSTSAGLRGHRASAPGNSDGSLTSASPHAGSLDQRRWQSRESRALPRHTRLFLIDGVVDVLGHKRANPSFRFGGKACGQQVDGTKGARLVRNGDLCLFKIAPHLCGDEADQQTEDDAERRQHPGEKAA
jgi:hypothetical protein